jgi:hypothetical protein
MKPGEITNKGAIIWIDNPSELIPDPLVKTSKGIYRASELEVKLMEEYLIGGRWYTKAWFPNLIEKKRVRPLTIND